MIRGVMRNRMEGGKWDCEAERGGNMNWRVVIGKGKKEVKEEWERERKEYMKQGVVGVRDASKMAGRIGIGGMI